MLYRLGAWCTGAPAGAFAGLGVDDLDGAGSVGVAA